MGCRVARATHNASSRGGEDNIATAGEGLSAARAGREVWREAKQREEPKLKPQ